MVVSHTDKYYFLAAWLCIHAWLVYCLLFVLDTDINRQRQFEGWAAVNTLVTLFLANTLLYCSLFAFGGQHGGKKMPESASPKPADSIFSSPLLEPVRHHRLTPASISKQLKTDKQSILIYVTAADVDDQAVSDLIAAPAVAAPIANKHCACPIQLGSRTHHCHVCDKCTQGFDHHCYWLGGCIGQHNHWRFFLYLVSQSSLCLCGLHHSLTALRNAARIAWAWQHAIAAGVTLILVVITILIGILLLLHTFLISANWKTYEVLKGSLLPRFRAGCRSPYDRGVMQNWYNFVLDQQLYNTMLDVCQAGGPRLEPLQAPSICDNSMYSCC